MKISSAISKLILVVLLFMPEFALAQNQAINVNGSQIQVSSVLQAVLEQVEVIYVKPSGVTMSNFYNGSPKIIPVFLGFIIQRQEIIMKEKRILKHIDNEFALINEIDAFLSKLAKAHNYINPANGSKMPPMQLQTNFGEALQGELNVSFKNNFGIDPTTVNIAYLLDRSPSTNNVAANTDDHAKVQLAEEEAPSEINLFGEVSHGAKPAEYYAVKRNGGPGKAEGQICPERAAKSFDIDTNGIWNDKTYCRCRYFSSGFLSSQSDTVNGKNYGMSLMYAVNKKGVRFLQYQTPYINGEYHGDYIIYSEYPYQGDRIGLREVWPYVNGVKHGIFEDWSMTDSGINYLMQTVPYIKGVRHGEAKTFNYSKSGKYFLFRKENWKNIGGNSKRHGDQIIYHSSGRVQVIDRYNRGEYISSKCFYKNGKQIKKGDPAALETWEDGYSCNAYVSWDKTDW